MSTGREKYLRALGLLPGDREESRKAALGRAHSIRQFEIELYWKRAAYFWVLQAAVFAGLGFLWKDDKAQVRDLIPVALSALGLMTAVAGWFASQGSKFWQKNWENHIDMLEDEFEGSLHKSVWIDESGFSWSVSRTNEFLINSFVVFWFVVLLVTTYEANKSLLACFSAKLSENTLIFCATLAVWALAFVGFRAMYRQKTKRRERGNLLPTDQFKDDLP